MKRFSFVVTGALLCISQGFMWGAGAEQLKWGELGPRVGHKKVSMELPGGVYIEGKVMEIEPNGLRLKISKTSDRAVQPKGEHLIPRQSVSVLHITEYHKLGRLLGTLGAAAAAAGIAAASYPDLYEGPAVIAVPAVVAAGTAGAAVGGYYIGKKIDRWEVEIRIVKDSGEPE
jgi:hypothetical protein